MAGNNALSRAIKAKNDEFYTQWIDIEREMTAYTDYDRDVFRDKTVLLPCDDPEWSNFTKYFALHFMEYGIKKLISTSYAPNSNSAGAYYQPTLAGSPTFDGAIDRVRGKIFILGPEDMNHNHAININDLQWRYLNGDGDFRSSEVTVLRDEADIIITNPPFSLFREFLALIMNAKKRFSIIDNSNAVTYREVFPLVMDNLVWKGATGNTTDMVFGVPKGSPVAASDKEKAARLGRSSDENYDYTRLGNSCWFTNLEHGVRHAPLQLMSMAENIKYSRHKEIRGVGYRHYDTYDAIEVPFTDAIPSDYEGLMGVPITFLDRYNPDQFQIVGEANHGIDSEHDLFAPIVQGRAIFKRILIQQRRLA